MHDHAQLAHLLNCLHQCAGYNDTATAEATSTEWAASISTTANHKSRCGLDKNGDGGQNPTGGIHVPIRQVVGTRWPTRQQSQHKSHVANGRTNTQQQLLDPTHGQIAHVQIHLSVPLSQCFGGASGAVRQVPITSTERRRLL